MPANAPGPLHLKVFIGSPGDVNDERQLAWNLLTQLPYRAAFRGKVFFEAVAWNQPLGKIPLLANIPAQSSVNWIKGEPAACDVVVIMLWSRLGSPAKEPDYAKPDGGFFTGTEWEFDNAMRASAASGQQRPKVLLYHRKDKPSVEMSPDNEASILKQMEDMKQVAIFMRNCRKRGIAINEYEGGASEFARLFEMQLEEIVCKLLEEHTANNATAWMGEQSNAIHPKASEAPFWTGSPFPGLRAFTDKDAPIFFGRGRETDELLSRLRDPAQRFIAVVGASGSGKSSLVWAGLIPRLMEGAIEGIDWSWVRFTPGQLGDNPFIALANGWKDALEATGQTLLEFADTLQQAPEQWDGWLQMALANHPVSAELLLFIDQFEELFTVVKNPEIRSAFVRFLLAAATSTRLRVVISVRADFYAQCVEQGLADVLKIGSYPLAAPGGYALSQMIAKPAALGGLEFEAGLVDAILKDTGNEPGALPLLAFALERLYQVRTEKGLLTFKAYDGFGKVQGSIGQQADAIFGKLPEAVKNKFTEVFRELVEVDERGVPTRRRARLSEVSSSVQSQQLIDALIKARLLVGHMESSDEIAVVGRNKPALAGVSGMTEAQLPETVAERPYSGLQNNAATLEVAHEALFKSWGKLAEWVTQTADDHRLRRQIRQLAEYWHTNHRKDEHRWSDQRVKEVALMLEHLGMTLEDFPEREQAFLGPINPVDMLKAIAQPETTHERRAMIGVRLDLLGDTRRGVGLREDGLPDMDWVSIEGGEVTIEIREDARNPDSKIINTLTRTVGAFQMARYPVTVAQFQAFLRECHDGQRWHLPNDAPFNLPESFAPSKPRARHGNHPMDSVCWYDAVTFCHWLSVRLGYPIRLPNEFEWQCAAVGAGSKPAFVGTGFEPAFVGTGLEPAFVGTGLEPAPTNPATLKIYPWGSDWNPADEAWRANSYESELGRSTAVGMYPGGVSASGVWDMAGTVWEWCQNTYDNPDDVTASTAGAARVLRGGSWDYYAGNCRSAYRNFNLPDGRSINIGFRCARVQS